jgi:hypothetical protein
LAATTGSRARLQMLPVGDGGSHLCCMYNCRLNKIDCDNF